MQNIGSTVSLFCNTITQNHCTSTSSTAKGAGLYIGGGSVNNGSNNIIFGNIATTFPDIYGTPTLNYSCSSVNLSGTGNITEDPEFYEPEFDDFHLLAISPCIDAGNPSLPLDPDTTVSDMGALYYDQSGGGMLVPYYCSDFEIDHNNALLTASLSWTNPSQQVNLEPLTDLTGVHIYRDGTWIADVTNVQIGQTSTYDDNTVPSAGMYEYELIAYNTFGEGYPIDNSGWIGLDTPGYPGVVTATPDPGYTLVCAIDWSAPTMGGHNGYWPAGSWTGQKIYRNDELIATLIGNSTSLLDDEVPEEGFYVYSISYYNDSGEGPQSYSFAVYVGSPQFEQVAYDWVDISTIGTNTGVTGDDQTLGPFPMGIAFPWYDDNFETQVWVCSNGWIAFSAGQGQAYTNYAIPTSATPNDVVCPYWDDLTPNANSNILYYHDVANSRFILQYDQVPHYSTGGSYTFEAIFCSNGDIDFMYNNLTHGTANSATVGIENASGTEGIQVTFNGSGPLEPQNQFGVRIHSVGGEAPDMAVTLTPVGAPIQIPAGGGAFQYDISIENTGAQAAMYDAWIDVDLPTGAVFPILERYGLNLPVGGSLTRPMAQNVPAGAPAGVYSYNAFAGAYPSLIYAEDSFPFTKMADGDALINPDNSWNLYGWDEMLAAELPEEYDLLPAYPNPFNPEATLTYHLPINSNVELVVFDVMGREVARLADGWQVAGIYTAKFNASHYSSGVYFAMLRAGGKQFMQKLLLVK